MMTKFNRFSLTPKLCHICKRYIWLEPYRKSEILSLYFDNHGYKSTICKRCIDKFLPKEVVNEKDT